MDVVDIQISEYKERIATLEKKVFDLEKSNQLLEKMLDEKISFSTTVSKIVFQMDCLLVQKNEEIKKLELEMKNMTDSLAVIPSDFTMDLFNEGSNQIEVVEVITMSGSDESDGESSIPMRNHKNMIKKRPEFVPNIKTEPVGESEPEPKISKAACNKMSKNAGNNNVRSYMITLDYEKITPKRNADGVFECAKEINRLNSKLPFYDGTCLYKTAVKLGFQILLIDYISYGLDTVYIITRFI